MKIIREVLAEIPSELLFFAFIGGIIGGYLIGSLAQWRLK